MRISPVYFNNYQYNKPLQFGAFHVTEREKTKDSKSGILVHISKFFREPETDKFVQDYVLENFSKNDKVKIISAGCSCGEEAYSYYAMLDSLKDKLEVAGFDLSEKSIKEAKKGVFCLSHTERDMLGEKCSFELTPYEQKCREQFRKYFKASDEGLYEQYPYFLYGSYNPLDICLYELKEKIPKCNFFKGDVLNLGNMFNKKSVDVLLMRNTLYLLMCNVQNNGYATGERADAKETINLIAQKMKKVVKPGGLVVFGEDEQRQKVNIEYIEEAMTKNGFEPVILYKSKGEYIDLYGKYYTPSNQYSHIWKKKEE